MKKNISILAKKIAEGGKNIVFTGAGISTESGIPDYRSKGGIWNQFKPVYFDEFMASEEARKDYWRRKSELYQDLVNAKPNPAHIAIAKIQEFGLLEGVITQNIDGLHQEAGSPDRKVIEIHGNTRRVRCLSCDKISTFHEIQRRIEDGDLAPECDCGGYLKPDTISFGQAMPMDKVNRAMELAAQCDVMLVIGSTLQVQPASLLPNHAKLNGAFLAIINLSETPYDDRCDVLIRNKAGEILPILWAEIQRGNQSGQF